MSDIGQWAMAHPYLTFILVFVFITGTCTFLVELARAIGRRKKA